MKKLPLFLMLSGLVLAPVAHAVVAYSPPVGGMTISVPAGQTRAVALPLLHASSGAGAMIGKVTGVGSGSGGLEYIDVASAGWTAGALSNAANPYYLRITSGGASGRVFLISTTTANTSTRITFNPDGVTAVGVGGIAAGDSYEIVLADTILSFFGSSTLQGGATYTAADNVQIWTGASWQTLFYNTTAGHWQRTTDGLSGNRDTTLLRPDRGFMITRRAGTELKMYVSGRVPVVAPKLFHTRAGVTFLSLSLPTDTTLGDLALQTRTPGWVNATSGGVALTSADLVQVWTGASWRNLYFDSGTGHWQRSTDISTSASRDSQVLAAGTAIFIRRTSTGDALIPIPLPYSL